MAYAIRRSTFAASATRLLILPSLACGIATSVGCSDDSDPAPIATAGSAGAGAGGASAAGASAGGASAAGASAGGASAAGSAGSSTAGAAGTAAVVEPFDPVVLFAFDAVDAGTYNWFVDPVQAGSVALIDEDRDPANATPGALRFTAEFQPYDSFGTSPVVTAIYQFGDATTGTTRALQGGTRVHFWIRQSSPTGVATSLNFFQPFIQGGTATSFTNNFGYAQAPAVSDNQWHEFVLEVAGQNYMLDVWRVGVAISPQPRPTVTPGLDAGTTPTVAVVDVDAGDAGGQAPAPVTLDIDYVWVE